MLCILGDSALKHSRCAAIHERMLDRGPIVKMHATPVSTKPRINELSVPARNGKPESWALEKACCARHLSVSNLLSGMYVLHRPAMCCRFGGQKSQPCQTSFGNTCRPDLDLSSTSSILLYKDHSSRCSLCFTVR